MGEVEGGHCRLPNVKEKGNILQLIVRNKNWRKMKVSAFIQTYLFVVFRGDFTKFQQVCFSICIDVSHTIRTSEARLLLGSRGYVAAS